MKDKLTQLIVIIDEPIEPIYLPKKPEENAPIPGKNVNSKYICLEEVGFEPTI